MGMMVEVLYQTGNLHCWREELNIFVKIAGGWSAQFLGVNMEMLSPRSSACSVSQTVSSPQLPGRQRADTGGSLLEVGAALTTCSSDQICCKGRSAGRDRRDHCYR